MYAYYIWSHFYTSSFVSMRIISTFINSMFVTFHLNCIHAVYQLLGCYLCENKVCILSDKLDPLTHRTWFHEHVSRAHILSRPFVPPMTVSSAAGYQYSLSLTWIFVAPVSMYRNYHPRCRIYPGRIDGIIILVKRFPFGPNMTNYFHLLPGDVTFIRSLK